MNERYSSRLHRTDQPAEERVFLSKSFVHLNGLIQQSSERKTPRISPTRLEINFNNSFAHPHSFYPLICNPLFSFLKGLNIDYNLKGSLVRQAADNILFNRSTRNLASYLLRTFDFPFQSPELSAEAKQMYKELLIESDIDVKFSGDMAKNEKILSSALPLFVRRLANSLADPYQLKKNPRGESKKFHNLGSKAKAEKQPDKEDFNYLKSKVHNIKSPENIIVAYRVIHPNLQIANIFNKLSGFISAEQLTENQTGSLIIYVKKVMIRQKMPVYKLFFAVDRKNDFDEPLDEKQIQTFFSVDFSQTFSKKDAPILDNRVGSGVNNHEIVGNSFMFPAPILGRIDSDSANLGFLIEYDNFPPSIYIRVPKKSMNNYKKPVILGPDWGKKVDLDTIETFSRAIFQAIEIGINYPVELSQFDQESLIRARLRFSNLGELNKDSFQFESLRYNLVKSFLLSPHKTIEYLGRSGLWDILFSKKLEISWEQVLAKLNLLETHNSFQEKIKLVLSNLTNFGKYYNNEFKSGLALIDQALELNQIFPEYKSRFERIYRLLAN